MSLSPETTFGRHRLILLVIRREDDAQAVQEIGRQLARREGMSNRAADALSRAVGQVARSMLVHAGEGEIILRTIASSGRRGVMVVAQDDGGTHRALALARTLVDEFKLTHERGHGASMITSVMMKKWAPAGPDECLH